jgi:PTS system nitrogen regulatory IIA component
MKITDILSESGVIPDLKGQSKEAVLRELAGHLAAAYSEVRVERLVEVLWERERLGSTAIAFGRHLRGVDFESLDGNPTKLFFLLVAPEDSVGLHLKALARVSRLLKEPGFRSQLLAAADRHAVYEAIRREDEKY